MPPSRLFHGTVEANFASIERRGCSPLDDTTCPSGPMSKRLRPREAGEASPSFLKSMLIGCMLTGQGPGWAKTTSGSSKALRPGICRGAEQWFDFVQERYAGPRLTDP